MIRQEKEDFQPEWSFECIRSLTRQYSRYTREKQSLDADSNTLRHRDEDYRQISCENGDGDEQGPQLIRSIHYI